MFQRFTFDRMAFILLAVQAFLVGWIGWGTCPNKTEVGHMGAAVYFWHTFRFDVFNVNPPLTRMISGLPVVLCNPNTIGTAIPLGRKTARNGRLGTAFIAANSPEKFAGVSSLARWSLIPLLLLGGYFGYRLSREMYGDSAGFVFLALWCFSPLLLAWGATICPDAVAAALGIVAVYTFRQWLHKPNWTQAAIAGVCLGLLPLTKLTWIIAFGLWPLIWCFWTMPIYLTKADKRCLPLPPFRQLAAILLLGLYTLNMGYLFDGTFRPLGQYVFISQLFRGQEVPENQQHASHGKPFCRDVARCNPGSAPGRFCPRHRHATATISSAVCRRIFVANGRIMAGGTTICTPWRSRMPLGTWCLVALAVGVTIFGRGYSASWRDEMLVLVPFVAILVVCQFSQTGFSVHSRYILPALPFLFVWTSKVGKSLHDGCDKTKYKKMNSRKGAKS